LKLPVITDRTQFCSARVKICEKLDECLSNQFADANEKVLHSVKVASFFQWPVDISTEKGILMYFILSIIVSNMYNFIIVYNI
jgi:hypothetical protein